MSSTDPQVPATEVAQPTESPQPTPSKSNTTKRLSLFIEKAKHFVATDKKPEHKSPEPVQEVSAPVETPEEVSESDAEPKNKSEKRKSILGGFFRSKSPVKEVENTEVAPPVPAKEPKVSVDVTEPVTEPAVEPNAEPSAKAVTEPITEPVTEPVTKPTTEPAVKPATESAPETTAAEEREPATEPEATARKEHKDNVIDQIKRSSIAKFFNKKKNTEPPKEETTDDDHVAEGPTDPIEHTEEKTTRPSSPLGRSLTHLFRGISPKKKTTEETVKDEVIDSPISPTPVNTVKVN